MEFEVFNNQPLDPFLCPKHDVFHRGMCPLCDIELGSIKRGEIVINKPTGPICDKEDFCMDFNNKNSPVTVRCVHSLECEILQEKQKI
jgi:hypothetical protein